MICYVFYVLFSLIFLKLVLKASSRFYVGPECLVGKVAVITGGNRGIGFEVAKCLASRGCKLILACRSKAEDQRRELVDISHNENIVVKHLDLKSLESVRNFAKEIHQSETKIDILINNAGLGVDSGLSADGLHPVMQTNTFAPFLLTHLLADLLKKSDDGRIIFTSSFLAFFSNLTLDNLNPKEIDGSQSLSYLTSVYGNSKLAEVIISNGLSEKLKKYGVKSNAIHPGMIKTDIWKGTELQVSPSFTDLVVKWWIYIIVFFYSKTSVEGAQGIVELAVSNEYRNKSGQFYWGFGMGNFYPNPKLVSDKSFCDELWKKLESFVKLKPEEKL